MKKILKINTFLLLFFASNALSQKIDCNQSTVDSGWKDMLGYGVCLDDKSTINFVFNNFDFNGDNIADLAVRFTSYPIKDGSLNRFSIFKGSDSGQFKLFKKLNNINIPIVKTMSSEYYENHPLADSLARNFPLLSNLSFKNDSIIFPMKISLDFGKSFVFKYDAEIENWKLVGHFFWVGEIPAWYLRNMSYPSYLSYERVKISEKVYENESLIDDFNIFKEYKEAKSKDVVILESNYKISDIIKEKR